MNDIAVKNVSNVKDVNLLSKQEVINSEVLNNFINFLDVAPLTVKAYRSGLRMFFGFLAVNGISNPNREDILSFKRELENAGKKPSTLALYLSSIKRFFAWTDTTGIYENIAVGIKAPKLSKGHKKDCLAAPQLKSILRDIDRSDREGLRNYAIMALMSCGGLRTVEVTRANVEDLDSAGGLPVLYIQGKGRTEKADFIKLPPQVESAIRDYLEARGPVEKDAPLFASESKRNKGQRLTTRTISRVAKQSMIKAGYNSPRLTAHSLRHSAITLALLSGQALPDVQAFARHSSINTTMIYNHAVNRMTSKCESSIAAEIF